MNRALDHRRSAVDRLLPVHARRDLRIVETAFAGDAAYVVQDPVSGEAFQFTSEEFAMFTALRRPISLRGLQQELESRFAPRRATIEQLQQFVNRLYEQGLLVGDDRGQGARLLARGRQESHRRRLTRWRQLLAFRLGGFDAGPLVERLYGWLGWAFSPGALAVVAVLLLYAVVLTIGRADQLAAGLPSLNELTQPAFLPIWLAAVIGVKSLHELGHALACRHFGARPRQLGVLLLAGAPSLYCDVTDAWRLPSKWQRMGVSAAGMFVELIIASLAAIAWQHAEPGWFKAVALSLVVVCSVGTLLINANPLLRYDGYYLLADGLEVPNLADRARGLMSGAWRRWLWGDSTPVDPLLSPRKRRALWAYAVGAKVYAALILIGLFVLLLRIARPHHLQNMVYLLAAIVLAGIVWRPLAGGVKAIANPALRSRIRWPRLGAALILLATVAAALCFLPVTRRVSAPLVIVPAKSHPLFAVTAGELARAAPVGAEVAAGDVVVQLRNPELELALAEQQGVVRQQRTRVAQLRTLQSSLPFAARVLPAALAELADAEAQLAQRQSLVDSLTVRAPAAGRIVPVPNRPAVRTAVERLRPWSGSPLAEQNLGAWIEAGTPLAVVAEPGGWQAWAGVEQADVPAVEPGQPARLVVDQLPTSVLRGRVVEVARRARSNQSAAAMADSRAADSLLGDDRYHVAAIELEDDAVELLPGARGMTKISTYDSTLGSLALNALRRALQQAF